MKVSRRSVLAGAGAIGAGALITLYAGWTAADGATERQPLRIPPLIDARKEGNAVALRVQSGTTEFFPGQPSASLGYSGSYLGPSIRIYRGDDVEIAVTNALNEDTTVHWHGLLIPAELDGGPHQIIAPGNVWRPTLPIRQPAATLFYHSHVHGRTGVQVYSGLAGLLFVTDEAERALALPSEYGVDDLPVVIQDRQFEDGLMVVPHGMMTMMQGRRGNTILAIMPNQVLCRADLDSRVKCDQTGVFMRHNQSDSRNASRVSSGLYRPGRTLVDATRARAFSLSRISACI